MTSIAQNIKEIEDCFSEIYESSELDKKNARESFTRFPNGFFVNNAISADKFFNDTIKEPSHKDRLSKAISSLRIIKKLGTSSFEISIPTSIIDIQEKISALKMINDSLILWTDNFVYKIPASEKAIKRFEKTKENVLIINEFEERFKNYFLLPLCIETSDLILQRTKKCETLSLNSKTITALDDFLHSYFTEVFQLTNLEDCLLRGFQHGDMHFRNILQSDDKMYITDLDLIKENGFPFLDLMHFTIHLVRTIEKTSQYKPLESFLNDKRYLYDKLVSNNFINLSEIWLQKYHDDYISLYVHSQIEWYHYNKVASDELIQLERLQRKYQL